MDEESRAKVNKFTDHMAPYLAKMGGLDADKALRFVQCARRIGELEVQIDTAEDADLNTYVVALDKIVRRFDKEFKA